MRGGLLAVKRELLGVVMVVKVTFLVRLVL